MRIDPRLIAALLVLIALHGCEAPAPIDATRSESPATTIRVRIARGVRSVTLAADGGLTVSAGSGPASGPAFGSLTLTRDGGAWRINGAAGLTPDRADLAATPRTSSTISADGSAYPGSIHVHATGPDTFDVVNHVHIDDYLPGVLDRELYDSFKPQTWHAQAIVARTYALDRMASVPASRHYDVESTVASQAYQGYSDNALARAAVADSAGLVLTYGGRIFTAYYSSTCGGIGQTPSQVFGGSIAQDIPPLRPHPPHDYCAFATHYRWGPVSRTRADLSRRVAGWARANNHPAADLAALRDIRLARRNADGRPIAFVLIDVRGANATITADQLRHAANHPVPAAPASDQLVRSGHFDIRRTADGFVFENGRGFGHGMGMCQYGAEGMARQGYDAVAILKHHYPGAVIQRAY